MAVAAETDRVGISWRAALAPDILLNLAHIDCVEVMADDWLDAPRAKLGVLRTLAAQRPLVLHGISLGLASAAPVQERRLARLARLIDHVAPAGWSEHLAFVRAGEIELGHLAAPPRTLATVEGTARNVERARRLIGAAPALENVASLLEPPGSRLSEPEWLSAAVDAAQVDLLLDLHNLLTNAANERLPPLTLLEALPLERVELVHIAGGKRVTTRDGGSRLLDDHLHAVPEAVFDLLTELAARAPRPLRVILERDGHFPEFTQLLGELARARQALAAGRARRSAWQRQRSALPGGGAIAEPDRLLERFVARLYVEPELRQRFLKDPVAEAVLSGVVDPQRFARLDVSGLLLAARGFEHKLAERRARG